jgi:hypothetical protein
MLALSLSTHDPILSKNDFAYSSTQDQFKIRAMRYVDSKYIRPDSIVAHSYSTECPRLLFRQHPQAGRTKPPTGAPQGLPAAALALDFFFVLAAALPFTFDLAVASA